MSFVSRHLFLFNKASYMRDHRRRASCRVPEVFVELGYKVLLDQQEDRLISPQISQICHQVVDALSLLCPCNA